MGKKSKAGFLGGALVGLGLGFLFAPKTGADTRKMLADKTSELWDKVRSMDADEIKDKLECKLKEIEKDLKELDKEKVLEVAKEKAELVKDKVEELIVMAKESGKPVIEDAANAVKKELAKVTKNVLEKLEK